MAKGTPVRPTKPCYRKPRRTVSSIARHMHMRACCKCQKGRSLPLVRARTTSLPQSRAPAHVRRLSVSLSSARRPWHGSRQSERESQKAEAAAARPSPVPPGPARRKLWGTTATATTDPGRGLGSDSEEVKQKAEVALGSRGEDTLLADCSRPMPAQHASSRYRSFFLGLTPRWMTNEPTRNASLGADAWVSV